MRGKLAGGVGFLSEARNIPAYAGKTQAGAYYAIAEQEHPRVCGENQNLPTTTAVYSGTSPRMRGKRW